MFRLVATYVIARLDVRSERGATALEYAVLAASIAAVVVIAVFFLGATTNRNFECTGTSFLTSAASC